MAAVNHQILLSSQSITSNTTTLSSTKALPNHAVEFIIESKVASRTDGTYTTTIEHSPDGTVWFTLDSTSAQAANGTVIKAVSGNQVFGYIRASVLSASVTAGASISVTLWYRNDK